MVPLCWNCSDDHDAFECKTLLEFKLNESFLINNFDVLTPLRFLLLIINGDDDLRDEISRMESHCSLRRNSNIWNEHAKNVIKPLQEMGILTALNQQKSIIDSDFVQKICGILDVNSFEVRTPYFEVNLLHI